MIEQHPPTLMSAEVKKGAPLDTQEERATKLEFRKKASLTPSDVNDDDALAINIVAVARIANDWSAYQGPSDWSDSRVARQGDKVDELAATRLFYVMGQSGRTYRH